MGYSTNTITVERMRDYLRALEPGEPVTFTVRGGQAKYFAYKLREALAIVRQQPDVYPGLPTDYRVTIDSFNRVLVVPRPVLAAEVLITADEPQSTSVFTEGTKRGIEEIVAEWNREGRTSRKLYFSSINLKELELVALWQWAQENNVLIFENAGSLTLVPFDEDMAEFAWTPDDLED